MASRLGVLAAASAALLLALSGCGGSGGGGGSATRGLKLRIQWPTATRYIPLATTRIHLKIEQDGAVLPGTDIDVAKPTGADTVSVVEFNDLPMGTPLTFFADAYARQGTEGETLVGTSVQSFSLVSGTSNVVVLDLASTIDHLSATSEDIEGDTLVLSPGLQTTLFVSAHPGGDTIATIPFDQSQLSYSATGTGFTVDSDGKIVATGFGSGTVTVRLTEGGTVTKTLEVPVSVISPIRSLEIGTAGLIGIVNHQTLNVRPLIKALDKNGQEVPNPPLEYTITGPGLSLGSGTGSSSINANEGTVLSDGVIQTGTLTVRVKDSDVSATATVQVLGHGTLTSLVLGPDSFETDGIHFNALLDFIIADLVLTHTENPADYEIVGGDAFGNGVPLTPTNTSFSIPGAATARYKLTQTTLGATLEALELDRENGTQLTVTHVPSGVKLVIPVTTGGIIR